MIIATHIDVAAPAGQVWAIVGPGFADVAAWASVIAHSEPTPTGDGRRCSVSGMRGVDEVVERLTAYDDGARTMSYVADTGLPGYVQHATNTWTSCHWVRTAAAWQSTHVSPCPRPRG